MKKKKEKVLTPRNVDLPSHVLITPINGGFRLIENENDLGEKSQFRHRHRRKTCSLVLLTIFIVSLIGLVLIILFSIHGDSIEGLLGSNDTDISRVKTGSFFPSVSSRKSEKSEGLEKIYKKLCLESDFAGSSRNLRQKILISDIIVTAQRLSRNESFEVLLGGEILKNSDNALLYEELTVVAPPRCSLKDAQNARRKIYFMTKSDRDDEGISRFVLQFKPVIFDDNLLVSVRELLNKKKQILDDQPPRINEKSEENVFVEREEKEEIITTSTSTTKSTTAADSVSTTEEYPYSVCGRSPCQNGGSCEEHDGVFTCFCRQGFAGSLCQHDLADFGLNAANFGGNSRIAIKVAEITSLSDSESLVTASRVEIELQIKPEKSDGILAYAEDATHGGYLSVALINGFVEYRFKMSADVPDPVVLRSRHPLSPGHWHRVVVKRYHNDGLLEVDGVDRILGSSKNELDIRELQNSARTQRDNDPKADLLWLGDHEGDSNSKAKRSGISVGFSGCMKNVHINKKLTPLNAVGDNAIAERRNINQCAKK